MSRVLHNQIQLGTSAQGETENDGEKWGSIHKPWVEGPEIILRGTWWLPLARRKK